MRVDVAVDVAATRIESGSGVDRSLGIKLSREVMLGGREDAPWMRVPEVSHDREDNSG
jgi:hypothetical protein